MADGSELIAEYQYGFRDLVFGSGTDYVTTTVEGLLSMADADGADTEKTNDHGSYPGLVTMRKRVIDIEMTIKGAAGTDIENKLAIARRVFQVPRKRYSQQLEPFTFWRPGQPKKMCLARCLRREFTSNFSTARGLAEGAIELHAPSPLIFSVDTYSTQIVPVGGTGMATINMDGDYIDGAYPIITITGPVTTALIQNVDDDGRTIRLDLELTAQQTAVVDVEREIVWIDGVRQSVTIRSDNQWWALLPGENEIIYTRQGGSDASKVTIEHRDVWQ